MGKKSLLAYVKKNGWTRYVEFTAGNIKINEKLRSYLVENLSLVI